MSQKQVAIIIVVAGIIVALVSILADTLGIGSTSDKFGTRQIIGTIVGVVVVVVGAGTYVRSGRSDGPEPEPTPEPEVE